jgi:hypothetical protein
MKLNVSGKLTTSSPTTRREDKLVDMDEVASLRRSTGRVIVAGDRVPAPARLRRLPRDRHSVGPS